MTTIDPVEEHPSAPAPAAEAIAVVEPSRPWWARLPLVAPPTEPPRTAASVPWFEVVAGSLVALAVVVPLVVLAVQAWRVDWLPIGDRAVIELHIRDVGNHTPLIGPYSRYGWSHPGPLLYWLLAIPYRLTGASTGGVLFGAALVNLGAVVTCGVVAYRRGRVLLLGLLSLSLLLLLRFVIPTTFIDSWNPYITLLPLLAFLLLAWSLREGDRWAAPVLVVSGSFLVQSHIGYAAVVAAAATWSVAGLLRDRWSGTTPSHHAPNAGHAWAPGAGRVTRLLKPGPALAATVAVAALCWAPVVVDQISGSGNLAQVSEYFAADKGANAGAGYALGVVTRQVVGDGDAEDHRPPWLGGPQPVDPDGGREVPVGPQRLLLYGAAFALALGLGTLTVRRRPHDPATARVAGALHLQALAGLTGVVGWLSVARITDEVYNYLIKWWLVVGLLMWLSVAFTLASVAVATLGRWPTLAQGARFVVTPLAVGLLALLSAQQVNQMLITQPPENDAHDAVAALAGPTVAATPVGGPVLVSDAGSGSTAISDGLRLQLERNDRPIVVTPDRVYKFGANRDASVRPPATEVWVVYGDAIVDFAKRPEVRQVAIWDPLPAQQRAQYFRDVEVLRNQLVAVHRYDQYDALYSGDSLFPAHGMKGIDQELLNRVEELRAKGRPVAVFVGAHDDRRNG